MNIVIVGAGPVGCYLARLLKLKNKSLKVVVLEEHESSGVPVHCAGLVSRFVFSQSRIALPQDLIINSIDAAHIHLGGESFLVRKKGVAVVVDRARFDRFLSDGVDVRYNTRMIGLEKEKKGYLVQTDRGAFYADYVIGAEGANSVVRKLIDPDCNVKYYAALQVRLRTAKIKKHEVHVYLERPYFGWAIPEAESIVKVGIIGQNPYRELHQFLKNAALEGKILEKFGGVLPVGICNTQKDGLAIVGDAACQVKPLTHGGVYLGMRCAEVLADCITRGKIGDYDRLWRKKFGAEIETGLKAKRLYEELDDASLNKVFMFIKKNKGVLERFADFDRHSRIIATFIRMGGFQRLLGRLLLRLI